MLPELGSFILALVVALSVGQWILGYHFIRQPNQTGYEKVVNRLGLSQTLFVFIAFGILVSCFVTQDYSVTYVLKNSSAQLPLMYRLTAAWGSHEGSVLLWLTILSGWSSAVILFSQSLPRTFRMRVILVMSALTAMFALFVLSASNPFARNLLVGVQNGQGLNPLLQDIGFVMHPPILYMGYVGFSVAYAFALSALAEGSFSRDWAKWLRPWVLAAFACLTLGITLGSWWAYRELGWGGWWFWDPVENASFLPWLVGTALVHSLLVSHKRDTFKSWTILLAILAFCLSLLGTFLVRSGVLTSVHAFAVSPGRGLFILLMILLTAGVAFVLYGLRSSRLQQSVRYQLLSKEAWLMLNNAFLFVMMASVLLGTLYPLLVDALGFGKVSVGPPYFNTVMLPLVLPMLLLMALLPHIQWQSSAVSRFRDAGIQNAFAALVVALSIAFGVFSERSILVIVGLWLGFWIWIATVRLAWRYWRGPAAGETLNRAAMIVGHMGMGLLALAITVTSHYSILQDVKMAPGDTMTIATSTVRFDGTAQITGPNYHGVSGHFTLTDASGHSRVLNAQKRLYSPANMPMTEAGIQMNGFNDLYVAMGTPIGQHAWSVRVYYKPMIRGLWAGGLLIMLAGFLALAGCLRTKRMRQNEQ